jgi:hypothetical protein
LAGRQSAQRVRGVVEPTIPLLLRFKRVVLRYDRTQPALRPLLTLASALISIRWLVRKELRDRSYREANSNHE